MKKLIDVFPDWLTNGIFVALNSYDVPWKNDITSNMLDIEYFTNQSGDKFISPLIVKMMSGETLTQIEINIIAGTIYGIYGKNWKALWDTLSFEYNPIENYSMTETMTNDRTVDEYGRTTTRTDNLQHEKTGTDTLTHNTTDTRTDNLQHEKTGTDTITHNTTDTRTDNLQHAKTGTDTITPNTTETTTPNLTNARTDTIAGFNSTGLVTSEGSTTNATGTNTITRTGTESTQYNTTDSETGTQATAKTGTESTQYNTTDSETGTQALAKTGTESTQYNTTDADTGTQTHAETGSDTHTRNYTLKRSGNIGVTTSQQMIQSERDLWKWNFYRDVVFKDIDSMLTLMIY